MGNTKPSATKVGSPGASGPPAHLEAYLVPVGPPGTPPGPSEHHRRKVAGYRGWTENIGNLCKPLLALFSESSMNDVNGPSLPASLQTDRNSYLWACVEEKRKNPPAGKSYLVAYSQKYQLAYHTCGLSRPERAAHERALSYSYGFPPHMKKCRAFSRPMIGRETAAEKGERRKKKGELRPALPGSVERKIDKPRPTCGQRGEGMKEEEEGRNSQTPENVSLCCGLSRRTSRSVGFCSSYSNASSPIAITRLVLVCLLLSTPSVFPPKSYQREVQDLTDEKPAALFPRRVGCVLVVLRLSKLNASALRPWSGNSSCELSLLPIDSPRRRSPVLPATSPPRTSVLDALMSARGRRGDELEELTNSIDRSRKRHLDEGLLRGDQVLDRLRVQEASASPLLKKTRKSPSTTPPGPVPNPNNAMAMTMAEFKEYMDNNTNRRLSDIDGKIGGMQATIKENTEKLDRHEAHITEIRGEIVKMKQGAFPALPQPSLSLDPVTLPPAPEPDSEYLLARRSLRLWPIRGTHRDDLWNSAANFIVNNLGLVGKLDNDSFESVTRVAIPSGPGVTDEALVRFRTVALRDLVIGSASKLSTYMDRDGRATAGMRMEVPPKLQQAFRVLFRYGSSLRARHGAGTRRHVKFSDVDQSLYLNVKLPGDDNWSRVSLQVALRGMRARENLNDDQLERRLDITGPLQDARPKAHSTAGAPRPTEASAWTRRAGGSTSS